MELIALDKIDELLLRLDTKRCPWCDGEHWAMRVIPETDIHSTDDIKGIRALPNFRIYKEDDRLKGTMVVGAENALPLVVVRCDDCGFVYLFDYFRLIELYKEKNNTSVDSDDAKA